MDALLQSLELEWQHPKPQALARAPLYHQLYALLRRAILDGRVALNDQMPTEEQISDTFGVSKVTAKRAMTELANEHLIERSRGRGSHVIYHSNPRPMAAPLVGMLENYTDLARKSQARVLSVSNIKPPEMVRAELELSERETAVKIVRVHKNEQNLAYSVYTSWTPWVDVDQFPETKLTSDSRLQILREIGVRFDRVTQTLGAEAASGEVAKELDLEAGAPLLSLIRHSFDGAKCVDILFGLYNPLLFKYAMEMTQTH